MGLGLGGGLFIIGNALAANALDGTENVVVLQQQLRGGVLVGVPVETTAQAIANLAGAGSWGVVGASAITGGATNNILYNNGGVLGVYTVSGTGTTVAMTVGPSFTAPLLDTPASGTLTNCTGLPLTTGVTGVLAAANMAVMTATVGGAVPTPPNNTTTFLRGDGTFASVPGGGITINSSTITGGTTARLLFDNAGTVGEIANGTAGQILQANGTTLAPTWVAAPAASITVNSSTITGGTTTRLVYDNAGTFGEISGVTSNGTNIALGTPLSGVLTNVTGLPLTTGVTGVLPAANGGTGIANSKTLTVSNNLTLAGTDGTVMTFPATSATIARADAAQTFTGIQTFSTPIATGSVATMTATVGGGVPTPPNNTTTFLRGDGTFAAPAGGGITVGTSTITGGTSTRILYDNAGVVGESTVATDGTNLTISSGSLTFSGAISASGLFSTSGIRHKGVAATFTDTQASTTVAAAYINVFGGGTFNATNAITVTNAYNAYFVNPIQGTATITNAWAFGADNGLINGLLKVNAASGNLLQLQGAGTDKVIVTSSGNIQANFAQITSGNSIGTYVIDIGALNTGITLTNSATAGIAWTNASNTSGTADLKIGRLGAANLRIGFAANATPVANTITIGESSIAGTSSNVSGANGTIQPGLGTGTSAGSSLIFQTPITNGATTTAQIYQTMLTLGPSIVLGNAALATNATDGFIYIPSCAGTPTGVPTAKTGRVAMIFDTTNNQFWIYDGSWLQPKTAGAVSLVSWQ